MWSRRSLSLLIFTNLWRAEEEVEDRNKREERKLRKAQKAEEKEKGRVLRATEKYKDKLTKLNFKDDGDEKTDEKGDENIEAEETCTEDLETKNDYEEEKEKGKDRIKSEQTKSSDSE